MTNQNSPQPTEQPEVLYRWVKASERLSEDKRGVQIFRKIGHITTTRPVCLDYTPNVAAYLQTEIGLIEWLEPLPSPIKVEEVDALGEEELEDMRILNDAKVSAFVMNWFEEWCNKTRRGGGVLITTSIKELLMDFHSALASQVDAEPSPQEPLTGKELFDAWEDVIRIIAVSWIDKRKSISEVVTELDKEWKISKGAGGDN